MDKKIAIAVDGSVNSNYAVHYMGAMIKRTANVHCTLIHIQPPLSQYLTAEADRNSKALQALHAIMKTNREASLNLLEKARDIMVRLGVASDQIEICTHVRDSGVAEDLLNECRTRSYDAICVGRRGISYLQEMIVGSVTNSLLEHSQTTPVWMVDGQVPNSHILLAADGSPNALRALDHLCFMISGAADTRIHMIHVKPRLQEFCEIDMDGAVIEAAEEVILDSDQRCIDDFYAQALKVLEKNGFDPDRLIPQTIENRFSTADAIIDAARQGGFATIVLGRRGFRKSLFTGGVSRKIIHKSRDMAIWLVP